MIVTCIVIYDGVCTEEKEAYDPTGGVAYRKCCDMLGIVPVSHFLRNLQAKDTAICLKHHGLGPKGAKAIAVALTVRPERVTMKHKYNVYIDYCLMQSSTRLIIIDLLIPILCSPTRV